MTAGKRFVNPIKRLNEIGIALSAEQDTNRLMELVLNSARELTGADGGSLYTVDTEQNSLVFALVQNNSLGVHLGGSGAAMPPRFTPIPLELPDGSPNTRTIAAFSVLQGQTVNIEDAYHEPGFDFSGTRKFDQLNNYRSTSFLTVPMRNHEGNVIAAIQLINKLDANNGVIAFNHQDQELAESLASQGAVALTNAILIRDLRHLFDSFTRVIASAIDAKSAQTGAHCRRVPELTLMLAKAADGAGFPGLTDFRLDKADYYEISTAAWLHDCGKIVTPHHVVEKSTKLELVQDGIEAIAERFEIMWRDQQLQTISTKIAAGETLTTADTQVDSALAGRLRDDMDFLRRCNRGEEFMSDEDVDRLQQLSQQHYRDLTGQVRPLLSAQELEHLSIRRGTLSAAERNLMEEHMVHTINMLEQLPFPRHLRRVPEYAGGHHERMDGKGYPKGLRREQMSVPARMMGIADVFEALTAPERSYKKPMPLSQAVSIMARMVEQNHLDPDLFALFIDKQVYQQYAVEFLDPQQTDEIPTEVIDLVTRLKAQSAATDNPGL